VREEAGYTAIEACEPLKAQGPKLCKIENGKQGATPAEVRILCDFYRASAEECQYLVALVKQRPNVAAGGQVNEILFPIGFGDTSPWNGTRRRCLGAGSG
jgi:hypothetical protein